MGKMAWRIRSSKFRHVYGSPAKKDLCYEGIKITKSAHDNSFCAANTKFIAVVTESAGGGAFVVIPIHKTGRIDVNIPRVCGHTGPVLDIKWNPFNDYVIASSSEDATVKLWQIPEDGLKGNLTEWIVDLHGHERRVGYIEWHPTAANILLSAGYDYMCILWNTEKAEPINVINCHTATIFSIAWNRDGSMFATTSKDKKIRVIDPRDGSVISEGNGHQGSKASKVTFIGENNRLFATGFSRLSEREYSIWDYDNLSKPLKIESIDCSSGVMLPFYDFDTGVMFLAGKGDGNIRYYEIVNDAPYCHYLSQYQSGAPQRGLGVMCKRGVDTTRCEIVRFFKLHASKDLIEPISMIVPRKSEIFQEDIFPPTASGCPSLTADEWIAGQNCGPILVSMKDQQVVSTPKTRKVKTINRKPTGAASRLPTPTKTNVSKTSASTKEGSPVPKIPQTRKRVVSGNMSYSTNRSISQIRAQFLAKDGVVSQSPTVTTYKVTKLGSSIKDTGTGSVASKTRNVLNVKLPANTSSPSTDKLPRSVRNIQKLSSFEVEQNTTEGDPNKVILYDKKRPVTHSQTTTVYTNTNSPIHVDKKVWQVAYTSASVDIPSTAQIPKTDPELKTEQSLHQANDPNTDFDSSGSPFRRTGSLQGSRIKVRRAFYNSPRQISDERTPVAENDSGQCLNSSNSITSDYYYTPPSSPTTSKVLPFVNGSPGKPKWADNPLYNTDKSSRTSTSLARDNVDTTPLDDVLNDVLKDFESTASNFVDPSLKKASSEYFFTGFKRSQLQSLQSSQRAKSDNNIEKGLVSTSNNGCTAESNEQHLYSDNMELELDGTDKVGDKPGMLDCISIDAPDDTLIKPSKLRASMRSKKNHSSFRGGCQSSSEHDTPSTMTENSSDLSSSAVVSHATTNKTATKPNVRGPMGYVYPESSKTVKSYSSYSGSRYNSNEPGCNYSQKFSSEINNNIKTRSIRHLRRNERSKTDEIVLPRELQSSHDGTPCLYLDQTQGSNRFVFKMDSQTPDSLQVTPPETVQVDSKYRGSFRSYLRSARSKSEPEIDDVNSLRKAYFCQLEEIMSLKEQISLKDKRIRQLENELRCLRASDPGESNC